MQMETNPTSLFGNARVLYSVKNPWANITNKNDDYYAQLQATCTNFFSAADALDLVTTFTFLSLKVKALHYVHDFPMGHLIARPVTKIVYS